MGPRLFTAEEVLRLTKGSRTNERFNGAAVVHRGREKSEV